MSTDTNIISSIGAGSGIDIPKLVSQLTEIERAPTAQKLDKRQEKLEAQISGYGQLKSALENFSAVVDDLANNDLFNARSVTVPSTEVLTADKVAAGAQTGTYAIEVLEVASTQSLVMGSQADRAAMLGASGEMTIRFGEWTYDDDGDPDTLDAPLGFTVNDERAALSISVNTSDSLDTIAEKINSQDAGVQASVLKVDGQFQLMLTSPSGQSNALEITVDDASLDDFAFNASNFANVTETQQARDAELKINGLRVTRESNAITDVIDGFEFTLNKAAPGETLTYSITTDKASAEQAIRDFVDAYNSFQETAGNLTGYSRDESNNLVRGDLAGDSAARTLVNRLREMVTAEVSGITSGYSSLTNIGIRTERDGSLSIDEDELTSAISDDFDLFEGLFATQKSTTNSAVSLALGTFSDNASSGTYSAEITQDPTQGLIEGATISHAFPLTTSAGDYSFMIRVNGVQSGMIKLTGTYDSAEDLRDELQILINGDPALKAGWAEVDVGYDDEDPGNEHFTFTSREYGSISNVSFNLASTDMADLGISTALTGTDGVDVAGTIDGVEGFGAGNMLLPDLESSLYGVNLQVGAGATAQGAFELNFSRGFAGELEKLFASFTSSTGIIATRVNSIESDLDGIDEDRTALDERMEGVSARLYAQFVAMENIVNSLQATGDQLDGLNNRLPFTASS